jgi:nonsense-mediated mRNA decay protein 3
MLCVECGKREAKYENLCEECFLKKVKFTDLPKHMEVVICPHCGAVKFRGEWRRLNREEMLRELIERNLDTLHEYDSLAVEFSEREGNKNLEVDVRIHIKYRDLKIIEEHYSEVSIKYESCPRCNRYFGNYFEAILQIRGVREGELEEIVNFAHSRLDYYAQKNENLFITKEEGKHEGWDIYISDKKEAKKVADEISKRYGATVKASPHIVGRKDGRDVYRMTYSVRLPEYREGDIVEVEGDYYVIRHVSGTYLKLRSLREDREKNVDVKRHRVRVIRRGDDLEEAMVIYPRDDEVQIMDGDYKTLDAKTTTTLKSGDKVKIVRINGVVYVVP